MNSICYSARIRSIDPIPGADRIVRATVDGWSTVVLKDQYQVGDTVVIATTDALIPKELSDAINITNYLKKGRVRTVKLRGVYSECVIIPLNTLPNDHVIKEGVDFMPILNIKKYEPPVVMRQLGSGLKVRYQENPNFSKYYKFPNQKNCPDMFHDGDQVEISRKIHGTNARYGIVKKSYLTIWDRIRSFFGNRSIEYEFVIGSHSIERGSDSQGYHGNNIWYDIAEKYDIKAKLWKIFNSNVLHDLGKEIIIYGEIFGPGIQKNYDYNLDSIEFRLFDIQVDGKYLSTFQFDMMVEHELNLPCVERLYQGEWSKEVQDRYVFDQFISGSRIPHEGIVVKCRTGNRNKISKVINPDYLIWCDQNNVGDSH